MRTMRKHDFHQVLARAEEAATLLQHRIARNTEQLLQVSHGYPSLPSENHSDDVFKEVPEAHGEPSDNDATSHKKPVRILDVSEMTLPELQYEA